MRHSTDLTRPQIRGLKIGALIFFAGFLLALVLKWLDMLDSVIFIGLLFFPLLAYLVFSDAVSEISGPGGWGATFRDVAQQPVEADPIRGDAVVEEEPLDIVTKSSIQALNRRGEAVGKRPVALTLQLGRAHYDAGAIRTYLRALLARDAALMVIFVDGQNRFVAATPGREMLSALEVDSGEETGRMLIEAVEAASLDGLRDYVSLSEARLKAGQSNSEALKLMLEENVRDLVVTDADDRPTGIVRREEIMAKLLVILTSA